MPKTPVNQGYVSDWNDRARGHRRMVAQVLGAVTLTCLCGERYILLYTSSSKYPSSPPLALSGDTRVDARPNNSFPRTVAAKMPTQSQGKVTR